MTQQTGRSPQIDLVRLGRWIDVHVDEGIRSTELSARYQHRTRQFKPPVGLGNDLSLNKFAHLQSQEESFADVRNGVHHPMGGNNLWSRCVTLALCRGNVLVRWQPSLDSQ